jgi:cell wall-associated NlpC family hydrolase
MASNRRRVLIGLGATSLVSGTGWPTASAQAPERKAVADFPNPATFRTGDLVWPKKKGAIVPRTRSLQTAPVQEKREWEAARQRMLADPAAAGLSPDVAERLRTMSYEEFERLYFSTQVPPPGGASRSAGAIGPTISLGHVGMIELDKAGVPHVVEATPKRPDGTAGGVIRVRYADWLRSYTNVQVWHGRFRDLDAAVGRRVLGVARSQLGKPYDFFNFDLNDDRGFYCSKLVWMSIWRAARIAADDNPDPHRGNRFPPWFSPKALLGAKRVTLLHSPGEY